MRPLRLELSGFLSYRDHTVIDFEGIGAAVILGSNGAGKTSLVEAMSWALFAEGRGRGPDAFVSDGSTLCKVTFDFELAGVRYRVMRQREIGRTSKSYLGLYVDTNEHDGFGWQPVGGDHIAETQEAIERVLGMGAGLWMATSFIGQNRADAFTRKTPAERKQLVADLLGLVEYEARAEVAKSHERALAGEQSALTRNRDDLAAGLDHEPEARDRHAEALRLSDDAKAELERARVELAVARKELEAATEQAVVVERSRQRLEELRASRQQAVQRIAGEIDRAEQEADRLAGEVRDRDLALTKLRASASLADDLDAQTSEAVLAVQTAEEGHDAIAAELRHHESAAAAADERATSLAVALAEITERRELVERSAEATCYACGQVLTPEHRAELLDELGDQARYAENQRDAALAEASTRRAGARQVSDRLREYQAELTRMRELAERARAAAERARSDVERVGIEEPLLETARLRLDEVATNLQWLNEVERPSHEQPSPEEETLEAQLEDAGVLVARVKAAEERVADLDHTERNANMAVTATAHAVGAAEAALAEFARIREDLAATLRRIDEVGSTRERFAFWHDGYGRNGIPALVIENALPELQDEANRLLDRLSDGRLSVSIESLRATKDGALRETLDIHVADESDERPLEDFSGGERQMVDLALRIGLSRLLARRKGRPMETLILDEAFTALDTSRRQRAVEVIHTLAEEFGTVLFVTHLPEFADAFPVRFEITKNGTSRVEVVTA